MQATLVNPKRQRRTFGIAVWAGRILGWTLLLIAIAGIVEQFSSRRVALRAFPSVVLGLVALVFIFGLELFLHFFDRYLSRN